MDNMEPMQPVQPTEPTPAEPVQPTVPTPPAQPASPKKSNKSKKIIAIVLAVVVLFVAIFSIAFAVSSGKKGTPTCDCEYCSQMFAYYNYLIETGQIELKEVEGANPYIDDFMQNNNQQQGDDQQNNNQQNNNQQNNNQQSVDPAQWTIAEIVETYKHAAARTHNSVTSYQDMSLRDKSLKAPGINETLISLTEGVMKKALSNNSMNIKGITGGHQNLVPSDVQAARAYRSGNNIIIEMVMKEQVDKGNANMYSGTVGHAISVVGDIDSVVGQFSSLGIETDIRDENCNLHYKNPRLKVAIDSNGRIINGTWSYYVDITLKEFNITGFGMTVFVPVATAVVDFVVTLNGGFKG